MEAVGTIKTGMTDIVRCQNQLKQLIAESQSTIKQYKAAIDSIPKPNTLRLYAVLSGAAGAIVAFGVYKLL